MNVTPPPLPVRPVPLFQTSLQTPPPSSPSAPDRPQLFIAAGGLKQLCGMVADGVAGGGSGAAESLPLSHVAVQCLLQVRRGVCKYQPELNQNQRKRAEHRQRR